MSASYKQGTWEPKENYARPMLGPTEHSQGAE